MVFNGSSTMTNFAVFSEFCISELENGNYINAVSLDFAETFNRDVRFILD